MERWIVQGGIPIDELIDPTDGDRLHMSDWATDCMSSGAFRRDRGRIRRGGLDPGVPDSRLLAKICRSSVSGPQNDPAMLRLVQEGWKLS